MTLLLTTLPREHYLYFSDDEVDSERLSYLPKDTRLVSRRANNLALDLGDFNTGALSTVLLPREAGV